MKAKMTIHLLKSITSRMAILALGLGLAILLVHVNPASAAFGFEDPQLCVNDRLLTVVPGAPADVYVSVPASAKVDFIVAHCGGSDKPVLADHVIVGGSDSNMEVVALNASGAVTFSYNGSTQVKQAGNGVAKAKFRLP